MQKPIADLTADERRAYNAERKRASREAKRASLSSGSVIVDAQTKRNLLADLGIMILATNSEGSEMITRGLQTFFKDRAGFPIKIIREAKSGRLKPKLFGVSPRKQAVKIHPIDIM